MVSDTVKINATNTDPELKMNGTELVGTSEGCSKFEGAVSIIINK